MNINSNKNVYPPEYKNMYETQELPLQDIESPGYPENFPDNAIHITLTLKTTKATLVLSITDLSVVKYRFTLQCEDSLQVGKRNLNGHCYYSDLKSSKNVQI